MMSGDAIAQLRHALGLSMHDLAAVLGVSDQTVYRWESSARPIRLAGARLWAIGELNKLATHPDALGIGIEVVTVLKMQGASAAIARIIHLSIDRANVAD